ncbi:MAG TPA: hypothetical protein VGC90_09735, partial [Candidatus Limnocylindrales bacterium]
VQPRAHDHDGDDRATEPGAAARPRATENAGPPRARGVETGPGTVHLTGRSRQNKLVHLAGDPSLVGRLVRVRIEHAGPYALRGVVADRAASGVAVAAGAADRAATGTAAADRVAASR